MNDELDLLTRRYLDGELPPEREPEALRRMADDAEARALLRLELQVRAQAATSPTQVPAGFADRTMAALEAEEAAEASEAAASPLDVLARIGHWLVAPRALHVRPGLAAAAAVLLVAVAVNLGPMLRADESTPTMAATPASPATPVAEQEVVWTRFMYTDDDASSVAVAGDFSGWEPIPLSAQTVDGRTVWTGIVPVTKGEHQYMFVIDGSEWVTDPLAPVQRGDGFGNRNAVLQL